MTLRPPSETVVATTSELAELWRDLMGDGGFGERSLWLVFFAADGHLAPTIVPIDDIPEAPDQALLHGLIQVVVGTLDDTPMTSVAFLLSRPGPRELTPHDRAWARALHNLADARLTRWPVHLATADDVRVFAADDLIGTT